VTPYIFKGVVLPERASITIGPLRSKFFHPTTGNVGECKLNIVLNQITAWIYSEADWDIYDLRNIVEQMVLDILSIIGFLKGYAYDVDIRQVLNEDKEIDYVFGIDIPCLEDRNRAIDVGSKLREMLPQLAGDGGMFIKRCLNDLTMAMKRPGDTGFYCFRAIETLRQYCKNHYNLVSEADQWQQLSKITGYGKDYMEVVREFARPSRHGDAMPITSQDREKIFMKTWDIVEAFFKNIESS